MLFTIFTATFNRSNTLHRVYHSLCEQTFFDFEWLIVDDGSTDCTSELVSNWMSESCFCIRYVMQENLGKHIAFNRGVELANGELFLNVDSDDHLLRDSLEIFFQEWSKIPHALKKDFTGVCGLGLDEKGDIVGEKFPKDVFDSNPSELSYRYNVKGDKCGFHRTDVLKEFPFPELQGIKFYAEGIIWSQIGKTYYTRYINKPVCRFGYDGGNQLSFSDISSRSASRIFYAHYLNIDIGYLTIAPFKLAKIGIQGTRFSFHHGDKLKVQLSWLKTLWGKAIWLFALPFGYVAFIFDKIKK